MTKVGDHLQYDTTPATFGLEFQTIQFLSRTDQKKISAWYLPNAEAERCVLLVHGRNASKQNAISGCFKLAAEICRAGLAVLMAAIDAHGESDGNRYMWGVKERWDVLGAVDFLLEKGFSRGKIAVLGISLGGAAAIGAASESDAIGAVALDSTFADMQALIDPTWKTENGVPGLFLPGVYWIWQVLFDTKLNEIKPVREIVKIPPWPILMFHCENDEKVDIQQAYQLFNAVPEAKLVIFNDCSHAELYRDHPEKYLDALLPFLNENLAGVKIS